MKEKHIIPQNQDYCPPIQNQVCYPPVQPVPIISQFAVESCTNHETPEKYDIYEYEEICEIHAIVSSGSKSRKLKYATLTTNDNHRKREICVACFLIGNITKLIIDDLEQDIVQFVIECRYYNQCGYQAFHFSCEEVVHESLLYDPLNAGISSML